MALVLPLTLAACGGEEKTSSVVYRSDAAAQSLTRSGSVSLPQGAANALVCLDLKGTGICEASATTSTHTDAHGRYTLSYQPEDGIDAEDFKTAALLAEIPGDHGNYTLSCPGGKTKEINPLTTLVYRKMLASATRDEAEQEVARQLDIHVDAIYQLNFASAAIAAASLTNYALKNGIPTMTSPSAQAPEHAPQLVAFHFKDIHNYEHDVHTPEDSANAAGQTLWWPVYGGKINGNDRTQQDAAYTATMTDGFVSTGREEYLKNGVLKLFSADNQFTPILLGREATMQHAAKTKRTGYAVETTVEKMDISGLSMQAFFSDPASYQAKLKNIVHLDTFKVEDPSLLQAAVFPEGSVLHIQLSTSVGNKNSIEYVKTGPDPRNFTISSHYTGSMTKQWTNDLNPALEEHPVPELVVKYALNDRAWTAIRSALELP